jgi:hypothetical protein
MNLEDLDQLGTEDGRTRLGTSIRNSAGEESHFLIIDGPTELVHSAFAGSDFDITIEPGEAREGWEARFSEVLLRQGMDEPVPREDTVSGLLKPGPGSPAPHNSLAVILHQIRPGGTSYSLVVPFAVPRGASLFFILPPVCSAAGVSFPASGDPDLALMLSPSGPILASSVLGGLAPDSVSFALPICLPLIGFVPFFRVFGFLNSTGTLLFGGFAFP